MTDRTAEINEAVRCAQINFENLERAFPAITSHPYYRMSKHQLDCAVALINGKSEPELKL